MDKKLKDKIKNGQRLIDNEEDGSLYLQKVCSMKELKLALAVANEQYRELITDAITIKRIPNK